MKDLNEIVSILEDEDFEGDISRIYNQFLQYGEIEFNKFNKKIDLFIEEGEIKDIDKIVGLILNSMDENKIKALTAFREDNSEQTNYIRSI